MTRLRAGRSKPERACHTQRSERPGCYPCDRPPVIPLGARSFALLGQYVEIPQDVVFTVEYSVRGAMHAVYGLLDLKK